MSLPVLAISGPTASGKSTLAMRLATFVGAEIVSADSVQVYRGLDIGSAKPSAEDRRAVRHHGLDLFDPREQSDAIRWASHARTAIEGAHARGLPVIVVGGTGLYFRSLFEGFADIPDVPDDIRAALARRLTDEGPAALHVELRYIDPETAARVAEADGQRITRALAVAQATGRTLTEWHRDGGRSGAVDDATRAATTFVTLAPERATHRAAIARRAEAMVAGGMIDEVRDLLQGGLAPDSPGLKTLGYRAVVEALVAAEAGEPLDIKSLAARVTTGHAQYAKRQLTWFRGTAGEGLAWQVHDPASLAELGDPALARAVWPSASR